MTDLKRSLAAKRRQAHGRRFEESLERQHASYQERGLGKIVPHYPRTVQTPRGRVFAKGGAPVDYSGVVYAPDAGRYAVAFDAKVMDITHAHYRHPPAQRHQIVQLLDFHRAGAIAFLLFEENDYGRVMLLYGAPAFTALASGKKVRLRTPGDAPLWPVTERRLYLNCDWRTALPALLNNPDPLLPSDD